MAGPDKETDIREEMRIAVWWRGLIGDAAYSSFDPEDMLRWYQALTLRGPEEIRAMITERHWGGRPMPTVPGIVDKRPHPPFWLINTWLEYQESRVSTALPWGLLASFVLISGMGLAGLQGCSQLRTVSPLAMSPPQTAAKVAPYTNTPSAAATPSSGVSGGFAPPSVAPATTTVTGPQSGGIAGGASGAVRATGATGPTNGGASATVPQ